MINIHQYLYTIPFLYVTIVIIFEILILINIHNFTSKSDLNKSILAYLNTILHQCTRKRSNLVLNNLSYANPFLIIYNVYILLVTE